MYECIMSMLPLIFSESGWQTQFPAPPVPGAPVLMRLWAGAPNGTWLGG
jgi:hypothetical protein